MLRRLALIALAVLTVGAIATPAAMAGPPVARPAADITIKAGDSITASVSVPGLTATYSLAGTSGQHVTFDVSGSAWGVSGTATLSLLNPSGGLLDYFTMGGSGGFGEFNLNATGNWKVVIDPAGTAVGSATFKFAFDVPGGTLTSGQSVNSSIGTRGQNANYTFSGTSGQHVTVDVSATGWGVNGSASIDLLNPSGGLLNYFNISGSATFGDFVLNATGTWTLKLDPSGAATGSATFKYSLDINGGGLTSGSAVTTNIGTRGQNANYTFSGASGQHVTVDVSATGWGVNGSASIELYNPTGGMLNYFNISGSATYGDFTLNATGTWTLRLDPSGAATGGATFTYSTDIVGAQLVPGATVSTTIGIRGQHAIYTLAGTAGQHVTFDVSQTSWSGGSNYATVNLYRPGGGSFNYFTVSSSATYGDFYLDTPGIWTVIIIPSGASTGSLTFTYALDVAGGNLTPAVPVSTTIGIRGQNARYTFSGTSGQHVSIDVSQTSWPTSPGYASVELLNPTGGLLNYFNISGSAMYGDFTLNATGIWTLVVDGAGASMGSATFTLANDIDGGAIVAGQAVTSTIGIRGQNARYTLSGISGQQVTVTVSSASWGTGTASVNLYNSSGGLLNYFYISNSPATGTFTLNATGTWTLVVDGSGASIGSATFSYA